MNPSDPTPPQCCCNTRSAAAGGDGNLLFNVGPMPDGRIEPRQVRTPERNRRVAEKKWRKHLRHPGGPWKPNRTLASTQPGETIYLHVLQSPVGVIELPDIPRKVADASLFKGDKVEFAQQMVNSESQFRFLRAGPLIHREAATRWINDETCRAGDPLWLRAEASNIYHNQTNDYGPQLASTGPKYSLGDR